MDAELEPYLQHLLDLPFVREVGLRATQDKGADVEVLFDVGKERVSLWGEIKKSHLTTREVKRLLSQRGNETSEWILFAPHIGRPLGTELREAGMNYVDASGNCFLRIGEDLVALVEGRPSAKVQASRRWHAAGSNVLFALLAEEELLSASLREIGLMAGTSHQAAADAIARLEEARVVYSEGRKRDWLPGGRREAFNLWLGDYDRVLRPWLEIGRYRTMDPSPDALEQALAEPLRSGRALLGGLAAGYRLVDHHRGEKTVVHVAPEDRGLPRELRALTDPKGSLILLRLPGELARKGAVPETVHPLLAYAEILGERSERAREVAAQVLARYLPEFAEEAR